MIRFAIRRLLGSVPVILIIVTFIFFLIHLAPGDPIDLYINPDMTKEVKALIKAKYGLDQPVHIQYLRWLTNVVRGDFGFSITQNRPVIDIVSDAFQNTIILTSCALLVDFLLGILIGILSAVKKYSWFDLLATTLSFVIFSTPAFLLGLLCIYIFPVHLGWFYTSGMIDIMNYDSFTLWEKILDRLGHLVLPVFVLGIGAAASTARYMRGSMLEAISQDYIRTARAKGLPENRVILKHALRNSLIPVVTLLGLSIPFLFSGAAVTEIVFSWPGMGQVFLTSAIQRDYPVLMALAFIVSIVVVLGNLLADLLYAVIDPRVRYQ